MNISSRPPRAQTARLLLLAAALFAPTLRPLPAVAQGARGQAGAFSFEAKQVTTPGGTLRLEGNVRLYTPDPNASPSIDISAPLVTGDSYKPRRVRAQGGVSFKYSGVRRATKPGEKDVPVNIQARAREVLLDTVPQDGRRTLTLTGDLSGFYEIGGERTTLSGQKAVISFGASSGDIEGTFEGGGQPFALQLPSQEFGSGIDLGQITLSAQRASVNQGKGTARLDGGARLSSDGPGKLLVSGAAFDASFSGAAGSAGRSLQKLTSQGRVQLSLALPPDNIGTVAPGAKDATYPLSAQSVVLKLVEKSDSTSNTTSPSAPSSAGAATSGAAAGTPTKPGTSLVPVSVEISADSAVVEPGSRTLTLRGNVSGRYVLREVVDGTRAATSTDGANPGTSAVAPGAKKPQFTLDMTIEGAPVQIELPSFNLEL